MTRLLHGRQPGSLAAFHAWPIPFFLVCPVLTGLWLWACCG